MKQASIPKTVAPQTIDAPTLDEHDALAGRALSGAALPPDAAVRLAALHAALVSPAPTLDASPFRRARGDGRGGKVAAPMKSTKTAPPPTQTIVHLSDAHRERLKERRAAQRADGGEGAGAAVGETESFDPTVGTVGAC